ncbi:MAG: amidohydrolase [Candidatus Eisenbacteria bacterium]|nr:amidohydrolase [Candidatus Eisenbacteria bacterium]
MTIATPGFTGPDADELIAVRRDLHQHPELGFEEVRTSGIVATRLRALGLEPRTQVGRTGVVATLRGARPGRTVLLRADMDALPIHELNETPYRSKADGKMHACGHDCHVSILLAVARRLVAGAKDLAGNVVFVFQPAEELGGPKGGAEAMIQDGLLEDTKPDAAFGLHVWQDLPVGVVGVTAGPWMAAVDEFTVTVRGRGAHAAMPQVSRDPVVCLAHMVTALQSIVSRNTDPFQQAVVSVTQLRAGTAFNIIPESAWMNGTIRIFDRDLWAAIPGQFERVVKGVAQAMGCETDVLFERGNLPTVNDPAMCAHARAAAAEVVGAERVRDDVRTMGGEDFSAILARVPGVFIAVGSRNESRGLVHDHHHPKFDVDEDALRIGAEVLLRTAKRYLAS